MKKFFAIICAALFMTGCGTSAAVEHVDKPADKSAEIVDKLASKALRLKITAGDKILFATLEDNATVRDFLRKLPTTLLMQNLYGREMCYRYGAGGLAESSTRNDGYEVGDLIYWPPGGSLVILYKQNGELFERVQLGHVDGDLNFFDGAGDVEITFELDE